MNSVSYVVILLLVICVNLELFVFLILCSCLPAGSAYDVQCLARIALILLKMPHDESAGCAELVSGDHYLTGRYFGLLELEICTELLKFSSLIFLLRTLVSQSCR